MVRWFRPDQTGRALPGAHRQRWLDRTLDDSIDGPAPAEPVLSIIMKYNVQIDPAS
jgi:hypothetical protein